MSINCTMSISDSDFAVTTNIDGVVFGLLVAQLAANIVEQSQTYPIALDEKPTQGPGKILLDEMSWANHGGINALLSQVRFVYMTAEFIVNSLQSQYWKIGIGKNAIEFIKIIAKSLQAFQAWKDAHCQYEEKEHGTGWGSETDFYKKDWCDLNERLMNTLEEIGS